MGKKKTKTSKSEEPSETPTMSEKATKRKSTAEDQPEDAPKKSKPSAASTITAGTTIDQALLVNPKLKMAKKTKRAKQREKHAKNKEAQQEKTKDREQQEVKQYLQTWSTDRDKWKFQKLKQIFVQEHVFDEDRLDGEVWPIVLEYLAGTRGSGKDALVNRAKEVIKEIDKQVKDSGDESALDGSKYQRARDLLQYLG